MSEDKGLDSNEVEFDETASLGVNAGEPEIPPTDPDTVTNVPAEDISDGVDLEFNVESLDTQKEEQVNATLSSAVDTGDTRANTYRVSLPSTTLKKFTDLLLNFNKVMENPTESLVKWRDNAEEAVDYYSAAGLYQDRFSDPKSRFEQGVEDNEGKLTSIAPLKFKDSQGELRGEVALLKVSKMLGLGEVVNVPLPHSGIWVTIKPPTEKDLIDFYNTVFREKIILGRATYGLTFTNFSVHINNKLFDFILKHVHSVNYSDIGKGDLKKHVYVHDFPILAWGFARAIYPNGFDYSRGCTGNLEECGHITEATLNLEKLYWIDNNSLTVTQKNILNENRPNKLTLESYNKYKTEHTRVIDSYLSVGEDIRFKLKIPTFDEYTTDGLSWINGINNAVENIILGADQTEDEKTEILDQYVRASILRQFNHFVDFIEVGDSVINDRDTINNMLELFSSDDNIRTKLTEGILKFKADTTIALIGIPEHKCPACNQEQKAKDTFPRITNVIPIDTVNLFFLMLTSRITKILEKDV